MEEFRLRQVSLSMKEFRLLAWLLLFQCKVLPSGLIRKGEWPLCFESRDSRRIRWLSLRGGFIVLAWDRRILISLQGFVVPMEELDRITVACFVVEIAIFCESGAFGGFVWRCPAFHVFDSLIFSIVLKVQR
jgi:hypothetical protein